MTQKRKIRRGDVWFISLPMEKGSSVQGGTRPVLVWQKNRVNDRSTTVTVIAITSHLKRTDLKYHVVLPWIAGMPKKSMVLAEQIFTVDQRKLFGYVCSLPEHELKRVARARRFLESSGASHKQRRKRNRKNNKGDSKRRRQEKK